MASKPSEETVRSAFAVLQGAAKRNTPFSSSKGKGQRSAKKPRAAEVPCARTVSYNFHRLSCILQNLKLATTAGISL